MYSVGRCPDPKGPYLFWNSVTGTSPDHSASEEALGCCRCERVCLPQSVLVVLVRVLGMLLGD